MKFTPFSIKNQQFNKKMRGYDVQEVSVFLERLSDEFENLNSENEELKKDLEKAQSKLIEYRKIEKSLQDTLMRANESGSQSIETAKQKSTDIITDAENKAAEIIKRAEIEAAKLHDDLENLRQEKNVIIARIKAIINTQTGLVNMKLGNVNKIEQTKVQPATEKEEDIKNPDNLNIDIDDIIEKLT